MNKDKFYHNERFVRVTGPGFSFSGNIENCKEATNTILGTCFKYLWGGTAFVTMAYKTVDFIFSNIKSKKDHDHNLEEAAHKSNLKLIK